MTKIVDSAKAKEFLEYIITCGRVLYDNIDLMDEYLYQDSKNVMSIWYDENDQILDFEDGVRYADMANKFKTSIIQVRYEDYTWCIVAKDINLHLKQMRSKLDKVMQKPRT